MEGAGTARAAVPDGIASVWQNRLLPLMAGTLGFLTLFFCASLAYETISVQRHIESAHEIDLSPLIAKLDAAAPANAATAMNEFRAKTLTLLESNVIERRYHQATAAAVGRVYIIFLGFATGMVLALSGATFILGKLKEPETVIEGSGPSFRAGLRSGSPGLILVAFGTGLMICTILSKVEINVRDQALYLSPGGDSTTLPIADESEGAKPQKLPTPADLLRNQVKPMLKDDAKGAAAK